PAPTELSPLSLHDALPIFPGARIGRLDRDTAAGRGHAAAILGAFRNHELDVLVGTQMIAKGHDIHRVTLVGVIAADIGLARPDLDRKSTRLNSSHRTISYA